MAVVRGAAAATGQLVLCTGTGPMVVYVDADNKPTSAPVLCPDAALHFLTDATRPAAQVFARLIGFQYRQPRISQQVVWHHAPRPPARAPPFSV